MLEALATQIARVPQPGSVDRALTEREIAESLAVWLIDEAAIALDTTTVAEAARDSGFLHHQIRSSEGLKQYARSTRGPSGLEVAGLFASPLATNIDHAIEEIDRTEQDEDVVARLLLVPSRSIAAIWLPLAPVGRFVLTSELRVADGLRLIEELAFLQILRAATPTYRVRG